MAPEPADLQDTPEPIRFRPSKKRKVYRQRIEDDNDDQDSHEQTQPRAVASDYFEPDGHGGSEPAVVKAAHRGRSRGGVGFRAGSRPGDVEMTGQALVLRDQQDAPGSVAVAGITDRFTHQTGLINDLDDKHMNEYIESRLSSRATAQHGDPRHTRDTAPSVTAGRTGDGDTKAADLGTPKQPTMQGKLMEVDLPATEAPDPNRPEEASPRRELPGQGHHNRGGVSKKQRLGPDGKPWRSRKRRGSDDVKRDQLVEEFLHENRLDVYDVPEPQSAAAADADPAGDGDADERLAEEFRRQFMEDVAARRQKKKKPAQQAGKQGTEEVLKGPKLGGSRNSRAAVRDMLLKKEKEGKR